MVLKIHVQGYEAYKEAVAKHEGKTIFVLFCGDIGPDGNSWCGDCVTAQPVIEEGLKSAPEDSVFIHCSVGDRPFWKDKTNIFRTDPQLKLVGVPTLIKVGTQQRLDDDCNKLSLVQMLFEED